MAQSPHQLARRLRNRIHYARAMSDFWTNRVEELEEDLAELNLPEPIDSREWRGAR